MDNYVKDHLKLNVSLSFTNLEKTHELKKYSSEKAETIVESPRSNVGEWGKKEKLAPSVNGGESHRQEELA